MGIIHKQHLLNGVFTWKGVESSENEPPWPVDIDSFLKASQRIPRHPAGKLAFCFIIDRAKIA